MLAYKICECIYIDTDSQAHIIFCGCIAKRSCHRHNTRSTRYTKLLKRRNTKNQHEPNHFNLTTTSSP